MSAGYRSAVRAAWFSLGVLALLVCPGCGQSGAELAEVTGNVTYDGQPLPNVMVEFQPENGSPSIGFTDEDGSYTLHYTRDRDGARLGLHRVRITPRRRRGNDENQDTGPKIPPRYNRNTTLGAVVEPGDNVCNFELTSSS